jgi:hypothetical protein
MKAFRSIVLAAGILAVTGVHDASAQIDTSVEFTTLFSVHGGRCHSAGRQLHDQSSRR